MSYRIGHLALGPQLYLYRDALGLSPKNVLVLFYVALGDPKCNTQLVEMWRRAGVPCHFLYYYLSLVHRLFGQKIDTSIASGKDLEHYDGSEKLR